MQNEITEDQLRLLTTDLANLLAESGYLEPRSVDEAAIKKALPDFLRAIGATLPFEAPHCAGCGHFSPHAATGGCGTETRQGERTVRCGCLARNDDDPHDATFARHTCNPNKPGQPLPWGRKAPIGECRRCDQLRAGDTPREAHPAIQAVTRKREQEEQTRQAMQDHFAPGGPHARGLCGPVCTAFDW